MRSTAQITITIPKELLSDLDYISSRLGVTRSALLSQVMTDPMSDLRKIVQDVPENLTQVSESDILRARGKSLSIVEERFNNLQSIANDLFSERLDYAS